MEHQEVGVGEKTESKPIFGFAPTPTPTFPLLFCSYHGYLDPSSGAARATEELFEALAERGWPCGALCGPATDFDRPPAPGEQFSRLGLQPNSRTGRRAGCAYDLHHALVNGVRVSLFHPAASHPQRAPTPAEGHAFRDVFAEVEEAFAPRVLLTYGGHWPIPYILEEARRRKVRTVFALHNFAYQSGPIFERIDTCLFPSEYSRSHYRSLGIEGTALPPVAGLSRAICAEVKGKYVTFVNPRPEKGVRVFARIALELGHRRPDIPLLVVEGRSPVDALGAAGLDLRAVRSIHRMRNTADVREFYSVSRVVLMPSLWRESFGRVAAEAMVNGIPVIGSDRGALPETLGDAGFTLPIPERCQPDSKEVPTAGEVEPWLALIERLWDDSAFHAKAGRRARERAEAWLPDKLMPRYEAFFQELIGE